LRDTDTVEAAIQKLEQASLDEWKIDEQLKQQEKLILLIKSRQLQASRAVS